MSENQRTKHPGQRAKARCNHGDKTEKLIGKLLEAFIGIG